MSRRSTYVRSREYQYIDEDGEWAPTAPPTSAASGASSTSSARSPNEAVKSGFRNFTKVNDIIDKTVDNITRDPDLGLSDILALGQDVQGGRPGRRRDGDRADDPRVHRRPGRRRCSIESEAAPIFDAPARPSGTDGADELPEGVAPGRRRSRGPERLGRRRAGRHRVRRARGRRLRGRSTRPATPTATTTTTTEVRYARARTTRRSTRWRTSAARASSSRSTPLPAGTRTSRSCSAATSTR